VLAALTAGHKIGLAVVAAVFIGFALTSSFVLPRRRPGFPGRNGLAPFVIACVFLFGVMIAAVEIFGAEKAEATGAEKAKGAVVQVTEIEFKITLATPTVHSGTVTFDVKNAGKIQHDLAVQGGPRTPLISPGQSAKLTVTLKKGSYTLYCTVPGHRQAGMVTKLTVT
jgi:uncharacterized cupredoxin-like copper-binding protein